MLDPASFITNLKKMLLWLHAAASALLLHTAAPAPSVWSSQLRRCAAPFARVVHYSREAGDDAPIDVEKVEEMLFQRSQLRQDRSFEAADAIQEELSQMGVTVFDREMKWFVGAASNKIARFAYRREPGDNNPCDVEAVERLIAERSRLRKARDWDGADRVRDQLKDSHGVYIKDKELIWYVGSGSRSLGSDNDGYGGGGEGYYDVGRRGRSMASRGRPAYDYRATPEERRAYGKRERQARLKRQKAEPYAREPSDAEELDAEAVEEIQQRVDARLKEKLLRNFQTADRLLGELEEIGVEVSDDHRKWRADGGGFFNIYFEEGGGETPDWLAAAIEERGKAKKAKDFESADRILLQLEAEGIGIDDLRRTWRYLPAPTGGYNEPPPEAW